MPAIRAIVDPLRRDEALGEVRRVSGVEERVLRQVLERPARTRSRPADRRCNDGGRGSAPMRSCRRRTRCRSTTSCARSRRSSRSFSGSSCSFPRNSCASSMSSGPTSCPSEVARELFRAIVFQRAPNDQGIHPPFDGVALLLSLDDETAALARALYAKPGPDRAGSTQRISTTRSLVFSSSWKTTSCVIAATTTRPLRERPNVPGIAMRSPG